MTDEHDKNAKFRQLQSEQQADLEELLKLVKHGVENASSASEDDDIRRSQLVFMIQSRENRINKLHSSYPVPVFEQNKNSTSNQNYSQTAADAKTPGPEPKPFSTQSSHTENKPTSSYAYDTLVKLRQVAPELAKEVDFEYDPESEEPPRLDIDDLLKISSLWRKYEQQQNQG